jgi:hypothetical protein
MMGVYHSVLVSCIDCDEDSYFETRTISDVGKMATTPCNLCGGNRSIMVIPMWCVWISEEW